MPHKTEETFYVPFMSGAVRRWRPSDLTYPSEIFPGPRAATSQDLGVLAQRQLELLLDLPGGAVPDQFRPPVSHSSENNLATKLDHLHTASIRDQTQPGGMPYRQAPTPNEWIR